MPKSLSGIENKIISILTLVGVIIVISGCFFPLVKITVIKTNSETQEPEEESRVLTPFEFFTASSIPDYGWILMVMFITTIFLFFVGVILIFAKPREGAAIFGILTGGLIAPIVIHVISPNGLGEFFLSDLNIKSEILYAVYILIASSVVLVVSSLYAHSVK